MIFQLETTGIEENRVAVNPVNTKQDGPRYSGSEFCGSQETKQKAKTPIPISDFAAWEAEAAAEAEKDDVLLQLPPPGLSYVRMRGGKPEAIPNPRHMPTSTARRAPVRHPVLQRAEKNGTLTAALENYWSGIPPHVNIPLAGIAHNPEPFASHQSTNIAASASLETAFAFDQLSRAPGRISGKTLKSEEPASPPPKKEPSFSASDKAAPKPRQSSQFVDMEFPTSSVRDLGGSSEKIVKIEVPASPVLETAPAFDAPGMAAPKPSQYSQLLDMDIPASPVRERPHKKTKGSSASRAPGPNPPSILASIKHRDIPIPSVEFDGYDDEVNFKQEDAPQGRVLPASNTTSGSTFGSGKRLMAKRSGCKTLPSVPGNTAKAEPASSAGGSTSQITTQINKSPLIRVAAAESSLSAKTGQSHGKASAATSAQRSRMIKFYVKPELLAAVQSRTRSSKKIITAIFEEYRMGLKEPMGQETQNQPTSIFDQLLKQLGSTSDSTGSDLPNATDANSMDADLGVNDVCHLA